MVSMKKSTRDHLIILTATAIAGSFTLSLQTIHEITEMLQSPWFVILAIVVCGTIIAVGSEKREA